MGKQQQQRRRRGGSTKDREEAASMFQAEEDVETHLLDAWVDLLDVLGLFSDDDHDDAKSSTITSHNISRLRFQEDLDGLRQSLQTWTLANDSMEDSDAILVSLEEDLTRLRTSALRFLENAGLLERRGVYQALEVLRQLCTTATTERSRTSGINYMCLMELAEALVQQFVQDSFCQHDLVQDFLHSLDALYSSELPPNEPSYYQQSPVFWIKKQLEHIIQSVEAGLSRTLERRNHLLSQEALHLVEELDKVQKRNKKKKKQSTTTPISSRVLRNNDLSSAAAESASTLEKSTTSSDETAVPPNTAHRTRIRTTMSTPIERQFDRVIDLAQAFVNGTLTRPSGSRKCETSSIIMTALVSGPGGCGKTHTCELLESLVGHHDFQQKNKVAKRESSAILGSDITALTVIRPNLSMDLLGRTVGEAEDCIYSLFSAAMTKATSSVTSSLQPHRVLVLLDDIDQAMGYATDEGNVGRSHGTLRAHNALRGILAFFQRPPATTTPSNASNAPQTAGDCRVLVVLTAHESVLSELVPLCDFQFRLTLPDALQRCDFFVQTLNITVDSRDQMEGDLQCLAEATAGSSYLELSHVARRAVEGLAKLGDTMIATTHEDDATMQKIRYLLQSMQSLVQERRPDAMRNAVLEGFVDVRVWSARDWNPATTTTTMESNDATTTTTTSLVGWQAAQAWRDLHSWIVLPLCRARDLARLMNHSTDDSSSGSTSPRSIAGGVLLCGPPGTGKTHLAYESARLACRLDPSVNLVEVSCTSLIHKEVGGSEQAIRKLFQAAKQAAPCILLMDGLENIAAVRGNDTTTEGSLDRVLSTLLIELDGVQEESYPREGRRQEPRQAAGIAVIGVTHQDSWIDPALKRPGRLDRVVQLGLLESDARRVLVHRLLEDKELLASSSLREEPVMDVLVQWTELMTGSEIQAKCQDLQRYMVEANKTKLDTETLETVWSEL